MSERLKLSSKTLLREGQVLGQYRPTGEKQTAVVEALQALLDQFPVTVGTEVKVYTKAHMQEILHRWYPEINEAMKSLTVYLDNVMLLSKPPFVLFGSNKQLRIGLQDFPPADHMIKPGDVVFAVIKIGHKDPKDGINLIRAIGVYQTGEDPFGRELESAEESLSGEQTDVERKKEAITTRLDKLEEKGELEDMEANISLPPSPILTPAGDVADPDEIDSLDSLDFGSLFVVDDDGKRLKASQTDRTLFKKRLKELDRSKGTISGKISRLKEFMSQRGLYIQTMLEDIATRPMPIRINTNMLRMLDSELRPHIAKYPELVPMLRQKALQAILEGDITPAQLGLFTERMEKMVSELGIKEASLDTPAVRPRAILLTRKHYKGSDLIRAY
jgi:chaperonin cofactor prefoldin